MNDLMHFDILKQGSVVWNNWRKQHPEVQLNLGEANLRKVYLRTADLNGADLGGADLTEADLSATGLSKANLLGANLLGASLYGADLSGANLSVTNLMRANLSRAILPGAKLGRANLNRANLIEADLSKANLSGADLSRTLLIGTNLTDATLQDCKIYGVAAWDVQLNRAKQLNLTITPIDQPSITVDNLKIAQFIYLLLNNEEIRDVINTLTTKAVLILGRFSSKRKVVLDAIRMELRKQDYLPILFDFGRPNSQTVRETIRTLAQLSYFIIADLTEQSSIPEELENIIPGLVVPVKPLLETSQEREFSMFRGYGVFDWVLPIYRYTDMSDLLDNLQEQVIEPARQKALTWTEKKRQIEQTFR